MTQPTRPRQTSRSDDGVTGVSQLARAAGTDIGEGLIGKPVKSARFGVPLDPLVEASRLESLEPGPDSAS